MDKVFGWRDEEIKRSLKKLDMPKDRVDIKTKLIKCILLMMYKIALCYCFYFDTATFIDTKITENTSIAIVSLLPKPMFVSTLKPP